MDVRRFEGDQLRYWPGMNMPTAPQSLPNELWFHQVTITIHKDSAFILKVPVVVKDGQMTYSDSVGGFYAYKGEVGTNKNSSIFIHGSLSESRYTGHSRHGTPFYIAVSYFNAEAEGDKLVLQVGNLGKLVFRKVD